MSLVAYEQHRGVALIQLRNGDRRNPLDKAAVELARAERRADPTTCTSSSWPSRAAPSASAGRLSRGDA